MITIEQIIASAVVGALIGFATNWLAIKSLFRPLRPRWYSLGWQGVVPRNRAKLADNIARVVGRDLLSRDYLHAQLRQPAMQEGLKEFVTGRTSQLLDATLSALWTRLPTHWRTEGLESVLCRGIGLFADWSLTEAALPFKEKILDVIDQRFGPMLLEEVLSEANVEMLIDSAEDALGRTDTRQQLTAALQSRLSDTLGRDTPLEELLPIDLRQLLHQRLQRHIPELLEWVAQWLKEEENVDYLSDQILRALESYAEREGALKGLVGELSLRLFREQILAAMRRRIPQVANNYLHSSDVREAVARHLLDGLNTYLRKPLREVAGEYRHILAERIGYIAATWIASPETRSAIGDFLRSQYSEHRQRRLDDLLPAALWRELRQGLLDALYISPEQVQPWSHSLAIGLEERLRCEQTPLRNWIGLDREDEQLLAACLHEGANSVLESEVPSLLARFEVADLVRLKVMEFDLLRVERLIKDIISEQLRYINLLGALLGAVVGLLLPFLNALVADNGCSMY